MLLKKKKKKKKIGTNLHLETLDYRIYYVYIDLYHQYGISATESQTFLLMKCPSAAMSEKKRKSAVRWLTNLWPIFSTFFPPCLVWLYFNKMMKEIQSEIQGEDQFWSSNAAPIMCSFQNKVMFLLKIREAP